MASFAPMPTRQQLAYWFFWFVFIASFPLAIALSLRYRAAGLGWNYVLAPFLAPLSVGKLLLFIKHYHLDVDASLAKPSDTVGSQP